MTMILLNKIKEEKRNSIRRISIKNLVLSNQTSKKSLSIQKKNLMTPKKKKKNQK